MIEQKIQDFKTAGVPFKEYLYSIHRGHLKNHLEEAIKELKEINKDTREGIHSYNPRYRCGINYYKKCLREFGERYSIETFDEDYPEWKI